MTDSLLLTLTALTVQVLRKRYYMLFTDTFSIRPGLKSLAIQDGVWERKPMQAATVYPVLLALLDGPQVGYK